VINKLGLRKWVRVGGCVGWRRSATVAATVAGCRSFRVMPVGSQARRLSLSFFRRRHCAIPWGQVSVPGFNFEFETFGFW